MPDANFDLSYDQSSAQSAVRSSEATCDIASPGPPLEPVADSCSITLPHPEPLAAAAAGGTGGSSGTADAGGTSELADTGVSAPDISSVSPRTRHDESGSDAAADTAALRLDLGGAESGSPARIDSICTAVDAAPGMRRRGSLTRMDSGVPGGAGGVAVPGVLGGSAPVQAQLAIIGQQLAAFGPRDLVLGQYEVLGGQDQALGGAALLLPI